MSSSLIQTLLSHEREQLKSQFDPQSIVAELLTTLDEKARDVISSRAGLSGDKKITLSQIGQKFHLSRERIRQIERDATHKLSDRLHERQNSYIQLVAATIDHEGGVVSESDLVNLLLAKERRSATQINALRLFMRLSKDVVEIKESRTVESGWCLRVVTVEKVHEAIDCALATIETQGKVVDFDVIWQNCPDFHTLPEAFMRHAISLSKDAIKTTDNQYGLASWSTINPKNVRDKIYFVLYGSGKPLHFTEITKRIKEQGFDTKRVVQPTVHNELIADDRFVLVGRGIYALSQWGYKPGTVEDIIEEVLNKSKDPLTTDEIVTEVLKSRHVKKNTIIINLQIKPQFVKVGKKLYSLSKIAGDKVSSDVKKTISIAEKKNK